MVNVGPQWRTPVPEAASDEEPEAESSGAAARNRSRARRKPDRPARSHYLPRCRELGTVCVATGARSAWCDEAVPGAPLGRDVARPSGVVAKLAPEPADEHFEVCDLTGIGRSPHLLEDETVR